MRKSGGRRRAPEGQTCYKSGMHEMSIAEHVILLVEAGAARAGARRVRRVILEIGELAAIEPSALAFCFASVAAGGVAAGARLEIETLPGRGRCRDCGTEAAIHDVLAECPACGGFAVDLIEGREMRVREIEIEAEA